MQRRALLQYLGLFTPCFGAKAADSYSCQFQARAIIQFLSVPIYSRSGVGNGYLRVSAREEAGRRHLRFEFGAGSIPERAAGLNRLGVVEEMVVQSGTDLESVAYFGYMTASDEKNLEQARDALRSKEGNVFQAIQGRIERGRVMNRSVRVTDCPEATWNDHDRLKPQMLTRLTESAAVASESPVASGECGTFLHAIHCVLQNDAPEVRRSFLHNGKLHSLSTARKARPAGEIEGRIHSAAGMELSNFRLWHDAARQPVRFEFRPRSFLRLTFERV